MTTRAELLDLAFKHLDECDVGSDSKVQMNTWLDILHEHSPRDFAPAVELLRDPASSACLGSGPSDILVIVLIMLDLPRRMSDFLQRISSDEVLALYVTAMMVSGQWQQVQASATAPCFKKKVLELKAYKTILRILAPSGQLRDHGGLRVSWQLLCDLLSFRDRPSDDRSALVRWIAVNLQAIVFTDEDFREPFYDATPVDIFTETCLNARHRGNRGASSKPFYVYVLEEDPILAWELLDTPHLRTQVDYMHNGAWESILDAAYAHLEWVREMGSGPVYGAIIKHIISLDPEHMSIRDRKFLTLAQ